MQGREKHRRSGIPGGGIGPVSARMPRRSLSRAVDMRKKSCQAQGAVCTKLLNRVRHCQLEEASRPAWLRRGMEMESREKGSGFHSKNPHKGHHIRDTIRQETSQRS